MVGSGYVQHDQDHVLDGIEIEYLKPGNYKKHLAKFSKYDLLPEFKKSLASAWAMFHQAHEGNGYDIIECTDFGLGFVPWVIENKFPVVTRLHGSTGQIHLHESNLPDNLSVDFTRQTELLLLPACSKLITHSKANKQFWNKTFGSEIVTKIDPVFFSLVEKPLPLAEREEFGLVTARIQEWKGPVQLCKAISKMGPEEAPVVKWYGRNMIYKDGQSMAEFLKTSFPSIWEKSIIHESPLPNEEIKVLQQKAKFGIVPSTWDMFNFTCLEFLGSGTPLICSDGAGSVDLIEHGKNGFRYPAMDTGALAACMRDITLMNEEEYSSMATAALETVNAQLSPDKLIPVNMAEYNDAIDAFKPKPSNQFLNAIYAPSDREHDIKNVLDHLPLKRLVSYVSKRMRSKLGANIS